MGQLWGHEPQLRVMVETYMSGTALRVPLNNGGTPT
jgi:hypothetical protein